MKWRMGKLYFPSSWAVVSKQYDMISMEMDWSLHASRDSEVLQFPLKEEMTNFGFGHFF